MKTSLKLLFLPFSILFLILISCVKEVEVVSNPFELENGVDKMFASQGKYYLPVNLSPYNRNPKTKSSTGDFSQYHLNLDSLLDKSLLKQEFFSDSGWIYSETPFKSNGKIYAMLTKSKAEKSYADSLVAIKCYYVFVINTNENKQSRYLVTMIPTKRYFKQNKGFSFLNKLDYSGEILYSNLNGDFIRSESYDSGHLKFTRLAEANEIINSGTKAEDIYGGELRSITIIGEKPPQWNNLLLKQWLEDMEEQFQTLEVVPASDFFSKDETGDAGEVETRNRETYFTVNYSINKCGEITSGSENFLKGSVFRKVAPVKAGNCLFMCWIASPSKYSSNSNEIEIVVKDNISLEAKYTSKKHNKECYELMTTLTTEARLYMLSIVFGGFSRDYEFGCYWNGYEVVSFNGENCALEMDPNEGDEVKGITHSHNRGNYPFPSPTDFVNFCKWFKLSGYYSNFNYDIICKNSEGNYCSMLLRVVDIDRFKKMMGENENSLNKLEKKYLNVFKDLFGYDRYYYEKPGIYCQDYYKKLSDYLNDFGISMDVVITESIGGYNRFSWSNYDPKRGGFFNGEKSGFDGRVLEKCFASFTAE